MSIELTQFDKDAVRALYRLKTNPDFQAFQAWLREKLLEQREQNDMLTGDALMWSQGKCQAMKKILSAPETAVKILQNQR